MPSDLNRRADGQLPPGHLACGGADTKVARIHELANIASSRLLFWTEWEGYTNIQVRRIAEITRLL